MKTRKSGIYTVTFILLSLTITASSCDVHFQNNFFRSSERFTEKKLTGTWGSCRSSNDCNKTAGREFLKIEESENGILHVTYGKKRQYNENERDRGIHFWGKTYEYNNKKYICLWFDHEKNRRKDTNNFVQIYHYNLENNLLQVNFSSRDYIRYMIKDGKIKGYRKGGGMAGSSFYITSSRRKTRKAILDMGVDNLFHKRSLIYKRL